MVVGLSISWYPFLALKGRLLDDWKQMTIPDPSTILEALRRDSVYGRPDVYEQVKRFAMTLPEILEDYLEQEVTPQRFFEARFLVCQKMMRETVYHDSDFFLDSLTVLDEWRKHPERAFAAAGTTEANYLLSEHVDLIEPLKLRYRSGALMFTNLLCEQPGIFLL
jgi:hypothetical protein